MSDGPSFKSDLLGSATLTIFGRPIREVRVARPLVRRDRLGAHTIVATLSFRSAVMPLERMLWQVAARNVTAMTRRRSSEQHAPGSSGARRSRSRASASAASASPLRPCDPLVPLVVAERSDVGGSSAARVRLLGSACTSRSFGPRAPGVDASAARAAARRSVWSPRAGWTFDGHRLPRPPSVDPRARRVDPATGRGHAVERGRSPRGGGQGGGA